MNGVNARRDAALEKLIRWAISGHKMLKNLRLDISVRGSVAHIAGDVPGPAERSLVRAETAKIRGLNGVWDVLKTAQAKSLRVLDLGCGGKKQFPQTLGLDRYPLEGVDVLADMEQILPFKDGAFDYIFAVHCLEHVRELVAVLNEINRILATGGCAHIMVPNYRCLNSVADPTHVRFFDRQTFKYFCLPHPGVRMFRPVLVSATADNILADLSPVKNGETPATEEELALVFD